MIEGFSDEEKEEYEKNIDLLLEALEEVPDSQKSILMTMGGIQFASSLSNEKELLIHYLHVIKSRLDDIEYEELENDD